MAGGTKIASFFAQLGIQVDQQGMAQAEGGLGRLTGAVKGFIVAAGVIATGRAVASAVDEITRLGDATAKLAVGLGVSTDALQTFDFAAERSGVGVNEFHNALAKLPRKIADAAAGSKSMQRTFRSLGLSTANLIKLSPEDQFLAIADGFKQIEDPAKRTVAALRIFEETGAKFVPLLREGSDGIRGLGRELTDLGGRMDADTIKATVRWRDAMTDVDRAIRGLKVQLVNGLLPPLQWLVDKFIELSKSDSFRRKIDKVVQALEALAVAAGVGAVLALVTMSGAIWASASAFGGLLLSMAPILVAGAALILIYDELIGTLQGQDTQYNAFLNWLDKTAEAGPGIDTLRFIFGGLGDMLGEAYLAVVDMGRAFSDWLSSSFVSKLETVVGLFGKARAFGRSIGENLTVESATEALGVASDVLSPTGVVRRLAGATISAGTNAQSITATSGLRPGSASEALFGDVNVTVNGASKSEAIEITTRAMTKAATQIRAQGTPGL